ncbi:MAG TPA: HAMP domain-containing sensor histidine kinase, partial [Haloplasmataceae bacterium]
PLINSENIILTGKFEYDDGWRYVRITTSVEAIEASIAALTKVNTFIAVLVLVIGIIGSYIFARRFSRPIQKIQDVARNVALLNFEARADENLSTSELRDLSVSINAMSNKLKSLISDLQASNEKLQADVDYQKRLDRMRREFVANVSHELKTPLHLILMYSENLKNNIENIDKDYYCDTIIEETKRLNDMVKSLLDLSAIENGLTKMYMEELDLSDFAECTVSKMTVLFEGLSTNVGIEKGISVVGDGKYLEQAMKNFIVNAVSHTPVGGSISVELKQWDGKAVFSVFNEGSPIAEADIPQIWESFYKTDKARVRTDENHSGLGLYVVKTIIEAHGGEYGVRNAENGVEFWFSLPIEKNS